MNPLIPCIALATAAFAASIAIASDTPHWRTDQKSCVTKQTGLDGKRDSCPISLRIEAPEGFAFLSATVRNVTLDHRGTGGGCGPVELVSKDSGLARYVVAATASGNARSNKGPASGTGRVECRLEGQYGNLP